MKKQIKIVLKSDLCAGSGESLGSLIDTDVCYDNYGLIYIPSKRLKGLLREAFIEYKDWTDDEERAKLNIMESKLFGNEGDNSSCDLKIDNAYLRDFEDVQNDIENVEEKYKKYLFKQRIINASTYVRYQTAIDNETGVAKDNSLRTMRVIEKGTEFYANIECTEEEAEVIGKCLRLVNHIGTTRTRGFGEILCLLGNSNETQIEDLNYEFADDANYKIELLLKTESNIMVSKQNSEISEDYIPGSNIMGSIASKYIEENGIESFENISEEFRNLFLNGKVKYSNAYITEKNGKLKYYPAPLSFSKIKNQSGEYRNKMLDLDEKQDIQLSNLSNEYVTLDGDNYIKDVRLIEHYHHQRAKDARIGHVFQGADGGAFYQFTSIDMNQYFLSTIELKGKYAKKILNYIKVGEILRVGKSKTAEYGKLKIEKINVNEIKENTKNYRKFAVILTSPVILFDKENIKFANDKAVLVKELKNLFENENLRVTKSFIGYSDEGGYNAIWNLAKEQMPSYEKGTTICFETDNEISLKDEYWLGLRQNEGYGKLKIFNIPDGMDAKLNLIEYKDKNNELVKYKDLQKITKKVLKKVIQNTIYEEIQNDVFERIDSKKITLNNTTIGRILLMIKESSSKEELMKNVKAIKDNEKLDKVLNIISNDSNLFKLTAYQDYLSLFENNNIPEEDKNNFLLEYVKQFFTILKFKGGENDDN